MKAPFRLEIEGLARAFASAVVRAALVGSVAEVAEASGIVGRRSSRRATAPRGEAISPPRARRNRGRKARAKARAYRAHDYRALIEAFVAAVRDGGSVSTGEFRKAQGVDRNVSRKVAIAAVASGAVKRVGTRVTSRYVLG